jgi:hypothetical protein
MTFNVKKLTDHLQISDHVLSDLKEQIVKSFDDEMEMRAILRQQCLNREETHCLSCDNEGDCFILNGIIYLKLDDTNNAIIELENANQHLRSKDETWNSITGLVLLGIAFEKSQKKHLALREYKKAQEILTNNYLRVHANEYNDNIKNARRLKNELQNKLDELSALDLSVTTPFKTDTGNTNSNPHFPKKNTPQPAKAWLALPWMPTYIGLQTGTKEPIWVGHLPEDKGTFITEIILNDNPHEVYSLKQDDNLITLTSDKKYGWAKVSGNSMNASKPISILENNFVLFYESDTADDNAIVIAACSDSTGVGYQYVVRCYSQSIQSLVSETEPPNKYNPMPIIDEVRIIGVVIAVAKASN